VQRCRIQPFQESLQFHDDHDVDSIAKVLFCIEVGFFHAQIFPVFFPEDFRNAINNSMVECAVI
jgi:hypothetical protein